MNGVISMLVTQADQSVFTNEGRSRGEGSVDEVVLQHCDQALADPAPRKLIVVHLLGAHPAYNYRYPEHDGQFESEFNDSVARSALIKRMSWIMPF